MVSILGSNVTLRAPSARALTGISLRSATTPEVREHRRAMDSLLADPVRDPEIMQVVADDGTAIYTEARGPAEGVPVVLSHGWSCHSRFWNAQINELSAEHRVIVYDQRGHGRTPSGSSAPTVETLGRDLEAVLRDAVPSGRRAVVVGHSMGGIAISAWAGQRASRVGERVRGIVLASTATDRILLDFGVLPFPTHLPGAFTIGKAALSAPVSSALLPSWGFQYATMGANATRAQVAFSREIVRSCVSRNRGRWGSALSEIDLRAGLSNISVPTTVIVGTQDRLTPVVHAERMAATLEGLGVLERHVVLDGIGHMSPVEAPFEFNEELRHLIERTGGPHSVD